MELDARSKANQAIDRRARQRQAAAAAQLELTPEAILLEEQRQRENAALLHGGNVLEPSPPVPVDEIGPANADLSAKLAEAVAPVLEGADETVIGAGRAIMQWILVSSDDPENSDGYQLALQVQVDEQVPGGVVLEISQQMLKQWRDGIQNKDGETRFAAGIVEKTIEIASLETGNALIYHLRELMREPTRTAVGDDDDVAE